MWAAPRIAGATTPAPGWTLRTLRPDEELRAVFGTSRDDVWIGGEHGTLLHTRDGGKHFQQTRLDGDEAIASIWAAKPDDVWVLGEHRVHRIVDSGTLATLSVPLDYGQSDYGIEGRISGGSASDVWIATGKELVHTRDGGTSWSLVNFGAWHRSSDVWARSSAEIWVNLMFCVQYSSDSGTTWTMPDGICSEEHYHVRGAGIRDVWVFTLDEGPAVSVDNGLTWQWSESQVADPDRKWRDLSPTGDGAAWGATTAGLWWGSSTGKWRRVLANGDLHALWASGPHDVWAVGSRGTILHGG